MEDDLGRADAVKPSVPVDLTVSTDGLHVALLSSLDSVSMLNDFLTVGEHCFHISVSILLMVQKIPLYISGISMGHPVILRMHQHRIVEGFMKIKHRFQHLIFDFDDAQCLVYCFFRLPGHNGHGIPHTPDSPIQNQPVIRRRLRKGLSCNGKPVLRHVFPGINGHNARYFQGCCRIDILNKCVSMRTS